MDPSTDARPSGLPRPVSRLPVPRAGVRRSASKDNLQQSARPNIISNPRLRSTPSRDQLSSSSTRQPLRTPAPGISQDRETSGGTVVHISNQPLRKSSNNALFKKPSKSVLREREHIGLDSKEDRVIAENGTRAGIVWSGQSNSRSRPSLSERTMETLQNIPPSPAVRKRTSDFFSLESPVRSTAQSSRPGSSSQADVSMGPPVRSFSSRPSSSSNEISIPPDFRASTNTFRAPKSSLQPITPIKRPSTGKLIKTPSTVQSSKDSSKFSDPLEGSPSSVKGSAKLPAGTLNSRTFSSRPLKPRASVTGLFRESSVPASDQSSELGITKPVTLSNTPSAAKSATSKASKTTTATTASLDQTANQRKSSAALRDQIAKAKAAKRAVTSKTQSSISPNNMNEVPVIPSGTFDFGLSDNPFDQNANHDHAKGLLRRRVNAARTDGRLNIAAMGFKDMPEEVMNMYNIESIEGGSWAEAVDLTRFIAADNEFEILDDEVFPDINPREAIDEEDARGNQFGGLETLDLHGNVLIAVPIGLRRLELLTTLNLVCVFELPAVMDTNVLLKSHNKLPNECFDVISQIPSLRDLKIAGNALSGPLSANVTKLQNLEVLDIQCNTLTSLPEGLAELVRLRILNISENCFTSLPFEVLCQLPLIELLAAKNNLTGVLIGQEVEGLPQLQVLNVNGNALTEITASEQLRMPVLHQLSCSSNRLTRLPDMTSWLSLLTLAAEDNKISMIPEGFVELPRVRNVDLGGNNLKVLDDRIGGIESLDILRISGNPLREKKFASMTTEDLKRTLKARMEPIEQVVEISPEDGAFYSAQASPTSPRPSSADWPVKPGGVLDRSNTQSYSLNPVAAAHVSADNVIKSLELHHNSFKEIPSSIAFFAATLTSLNLAHNELNSDTFLMDDLELPALKELNLSSNTFSSVQPLIQRLQAPQLEKLDISFNRLTSLPPLKPHFANLWTLLASNNTIRDLSPESVKGLRVLDCSSNEIGSLNARIGLLGGPGGLERLDVSGNRFRVPKYTILEKGTEATLAWLRDRIPASEAAFTEVD